MIAAPILPDQPILPRVSSEDMTEMLQRLTRTTDRVNQQLDTARAHIAKKQLEHRYQEHQFFAMFKVGVVRASCHMCCLCAVLSLASLGPKDETRC